MACVLHVGGCQCACPLPPPHPHPHPHTCCCFSANCLCYLVWYCLREDCELLASGLRYLLFYSLCYCLYYRLCYCLCCRLCYLFCYCLFYLLCDLLCYCLCYCLREDYELASGLPAPAAAQLYRELASAAESGWDFSSRWMGDGRTLASTRTTQVGRGQAVAVMAGPWPARAPHRWVGGGL